MMFDEIRDRVSAHYATDNAEPLLLSDLGETLRAEGAWPVEGERRPLSAVIETIPGLVLIRDPDQKAYVLVATDADAERVQNFVEQRRDRKWLRRLARPVLVAFCLDVPDGTSTYLSVKPPFQYATAPAEGFTAVEPQFRMNGVFVGDIAALPPEQQITLARNIKAWCQRHNIDPSALMRAPTITPPRAEAAVTPSPSAGGSNALERLMSAQSPEVAAQIILPIDIALTLSRLP